MRDVGHWTNVSIRVYVPAFLQSTAKYEVHSPEMWLQSKLHVLNKGHKKWELGDSLQNTGWKHPRNSWGMLGQSFMFEDGSHQPRHMFTPMCRNLRYGPPAAGSVPCVRACSHWSCISPSFWIWTMRLNKLSAVGSLFMLLNRVTRGSCGRPVPGSVQDWRGVELDDL